MGMGSAATLETRGYNQVPGIDADFLATSAFKRPAMEFLLFLTCSEGKTEVVTPGNYS
jgi:hypothetical protein